MEKGKSRASRAAVPPGGTTWFCDAVECLSAAHGDFILHLGHLWMFSQDKISSQGRFSSPGGLQPACCPCCLALCRGLAHPCPALEQGGTGMDKTCPKPHLHQGSGPKSTGEPGLQETEHAFGLLPLSLSFQLSIHKAASNQRSSRKKKNQF